MSITSTSERIHGTEVRYRVDDDLRSWNLGPTRFPRVVQQVLVTVPLGSQEVWTQTMTYVTVPWDEVRLTDVGRAGGRRPYNDDGALRETLTTDQNLRRVSWTTIPDPRRVSGRPCR